MPDGINGDVVIHYREFPREFGVRALFLRDCDTVFVEARLSTEERVEALIELLHLALDNPQQPVATLKADERTGAEVDRGAR